MTLAPLYALILLLICFFALRRSLRSSRRNTFIQRRLPITRMRIFRNTWFAPSKLGSGIGQSLFFLRFTCPNGKNMDANTPVDAKLQQWIRCHGGTISNHFP